MQIFIRRKYIMKKFAAILLAFALLFGLAACGANNNSASTEPEVVIPALHIDMADWPVIDGALACLPYYEQVTALLTDTELDEAREHILTNNTPASFAEIAEGKVDLIFCLHGSEEQEAYAKENGVTLEYTPFANDAFVFFVNKDNPVDSITMQQLYDIYAGKITNWSEVGGRDEPIIAYQRNEGSGSQTGLYQYVIPKDEVTDAPTELRIGEMGGIIDAVAYYDNAKGALGYSYLYFVTNQHFDEDIKLLAVDGYAPDKENIQSGDYPMVTQYCCVINADTPDGSTVRQIVDWCTGEQGQLLAEELYYVPVK